MRKSKIVATLGPASTSYEVIRDLIKAGLDVARINRSHGSIDEDEKLIKIIRDASAEVGRPVGILVDLQGPKIRVGDFKNHRPVSLDLGDEFIITTDHILGDENRVSTSYTNITKDVKPDQILLIDDGKVSLKVKDVKGTNVICEVIVPGMISDHKGINLPGTIVSIPTLTEKDEEDLRWALQADIDMLALSFVRKADDYKVVKDIMDEVGVHLPVIAKVEKTQAVDDMQAIVEAFDGIMVARGDLGVEMPFEKVPLVQKQLITLCRQAAKPVIVATQALETMIDNVMPTRAEVSDVANSILDGADATMTSGETAMGKHPVRVIETMAKIAEYQTSHRDTELEEIANPCNRASVAITTSAPQIAKKVGAKCLVAFTESGAAARQLTRWHSSLPVVAFTRTQRVCNYLSLSWGVNAFVADQYSRSRDILNMVDRKITELGFAKKGDKVVVTYGIPIGVVGSTNTVLVHEIGADNQEQD